MIPNRQLIGTFDSFLQLQCTVVQFYNRIIHRSIYNTAPICRVQYMSARRHIYRIVSMPLMRNRRSGDWFGNKKPGIAIMNIRFVGIETIWVLYQYLAPFKLGDGRDSRGQLLEPGEGIAIISDRIHVYHTILFFHHIIDQQCVSS